MTLARVGGQLVDSERTCIVPDCGSPAAAEPYQVELPRKADELERHADALQRQVDELRSQAEAVRAEVESAQPRSYICGGHRDRPPREVIGRWAPVPSAIAELPAAGRLDAEPGSQAEAEAIATTLVALDAHPPRYREPQPTPPRHRRASDLAGI